MNTSQPIKDEKKLELFKNYYLNVEPNPRNHFLTILGMNSALRISDLLNLKWCDIIDFRTNSIRERLILKEKKTGKEANIFLNKNIREAAREFLKKENDIIPSDGDIYIFRGRSKTKPLSRTQAWRIIKKSGNAIDAEGVISPHSLRKTFGYLAYKKGASPVILVSLFNHSSFEVTKRYLGIDQDEKDAVYA